MVAKPRPESDLPATEAWHTHLASATASLQAARQSRDVLDLLTRHAARAFGATSAVVVAVHERSEATASLAATPVGSERETPGPATLALAASVARDRHLTTVEPGGQEEVLRELDATSAVLVPLVARARTQAVLVLGFAGAAPPEAAAHAAEFVLPFALAFDQNRTRDATALEQHLAAIVQGSNDAIFSKDLDGIITSWNRGAEAMYGYGPDEIIGRPVTTLVPPEIHNDVPDIMQRLRRGHRVDQYETLRMTKAGERKVVSLTISPVRNAAGNLVGASTIARDITQRRRLEIRSGLIAELGRALANTLDEEQTLRELARHLVRGLADYAVTYSLGQDGRIRRIGVAHTSAQAQPLVERLLELTPPGVFDERGAGAVLRTGEPVLVSDIPREMLIEHARDGEYLEILLELQPVSSMILPLRARGRTVGAFACTTTPHTGRRYTRDDLSFAADIAHRAALAVDNARLLAASRSELERREKVERALRMRFEQLRVLYQMTEAVGRAGGLDEIYEQAFHAMHRYLGNDRASILLWDPDDVMRFKASRGLSDGYRRAVEGHTPWPRDAEDPPPIVIPEVTAAPDMDEALRATILGEGIRAMAFFPLVFGHRLLGKFMLYFDRPRELTADEIELCQAIGGTIAFAIRRMLDEQSVRTARDLAERASQAKSQFLGVMSHELRTPLNAVIGYADLLLMEIRGPLTAGQREQVERMRSSAQHQLGLIEELLTYTRLEAGREAARLMSTDVCRILADVAEFVRPEAELKGLDLRLELPDAPIEIVTDPARLRQIILNFAGNATKFTRHGEVVLRARRNGSRVIAEVADTGPGIPPELLTYIFEPFAQAEEGRTRASGGTGLGLAIARRFATMLGGDVGVQSEPGKGSVFRVELPLEPQ